MTFYRIEAVREYHGDEDYSWHTDRLVEITFDLEKETPAGYWITSSNPLVTGGKLRKWVSKTSNKRYAYPTKKQAMQALIAIKKRAVAFANGRLQKQEALLRLAQNSLTILEQSNI